MGRSTRRRRSDCSPTHPTFVPPAILLSISLHAPYDLNDTFRSYGSAQVCEVSNVRRSVLATGPTARRNDGFSMGGNIFRNHLGQIHDSSEFHSNLLLAIKSKDSIGVRGGENASEEQSKIEDEKDIVADLKNLGIPPGSQLEELLKNYFSSDLITDTKPLDHGK